jgi:hypothetical protein
MIIDNNGAKRHLYGLDGIDESTKKSNHQQGNGVYMQVWAKPTPAYIPFPD